MNEAILLNEMYFFEMSTVPPPNLSHSTWTQLAKGKVKKFQIGIFETYLHDFRATMVKCFYKIAVS